MSDPQRQSERIDREMPARLTPAQPIYDASGKEVIGAAAIGESSSLAAKERQRALTAHLMEQVCEPENLNRAYARVKANKGSPGVDGLSVGKLGEWIKLHKLELIASLLDGSYQPQPVRGVQIPKPGGKGMRQLGIPTVVDRLVQQAMVQVLELILDPTFSASSYGFRPERSAHDALAKAREYVAEGRIIVVDIDLEKFFDKVNHDILMARLGRWVGDKRMLKIIGRFLRAGLMQNGVCVSREEGTPQGGPLSPLLANLLLGHRLLPGGKLGIAPQALDRAKERLRQLTARSRGASLEQVIDEINEFVIGWVTFFRHAACKTHLLEMDQWLRHRLRCLRLKQCKHTKTIADLLQQLGVPAWRAWITALSGKGWWRLAGSPSAHEGLSDAWLKSLGLVSLTVRYEQLQR